MNALRGHLWTIRPFVRHVVRPCVPPSSMPWTTTLDDPTTGTIRLQGRFSRPAQSDGRACLLIVHGLGGDSESHYVLDAARAADRAAIAHLRLDLRGAEGSGQDFYNAALTADLRAALQSPALADFGSLYVIGYSLGGHLTLRYASEPGLDPRVRAVAAVCPPLDLAPGADYLDRPARWVYRRHVLAGLKQMYAAYAARRPFQLTVGVEQANRITLLREWDERIVAPRFGFAGADAYYAASSAGPRLAKLSVPTLLVIAEGDPMIAADTLRPWLAEPHPGLDVRWLEDAGHVGFPEDLDLGCPGPLGLESQVIGWLGAHGG